MRSFGGEFSRTQKVSLSGKSRQVETRGEVLERTRLERERRKQHKLETKSATTIQAAWRSYSARQQAKLLVRQRWVASYGSGGERATSEDIISVESTCLRELCFFANASSPGDVAIVSRACQAAIHPNSSVNNGNGRGGGATLFTAAASSQEAAAIVINRAQRLVQFTIDALAIHSAALSGELQAPRQTHNTAAPENNNNLSSNNSSATIVAGPLAEAAMALASIDSWKSSLGPALAPEAVAYILASPVSTCPGLFEKLAVIVAAGCVEVAGVSGRKVPLAETLCTNLVVRYISVKGRIEARLHGKSASDPASLFCIPALQRRCPSLAPLLPRLWRIAVARLHALSPQSLAQWLPTALGPGGRAAAGAVFLGNLIECFPAALTLAPPGQDWRPLRDSTMHFMRLATTLFELVPSEALFGPGVQWPAPYGDSDEEEDGDTMIRNTVPSSSMRSAPAGAPAGASKAPNSKLVFEGVGTPGEVLEQVKRLSDPLVLSAVIHAALPETSYPSTPSENLGDLAAVSAPPLLQPLPQLLQPGDDLVAAGLVAREACSFLSFVLRLPGERQKVLVALAFRAGLVKRLWFSYLRPAHAAGGTAWTLSSSSIQKDSLGATSGATSNQGDLKADPRSDPGWMLPLTLFSEVFSTSIMVSGDRGLYGRQEPLPLSELYTAERPHGVLSLLRSTLWHVLWVEPAPSTGGWPRPAAVLRSRFSRYAGRLMGQLHDRNGRRPFAPPQAFYAEGLPPERFLAEVSSGVAAGRDAEDPGSSRAWALLAHAPYLVPFIDRARVFQHLVSAERSHYRNIDGVWFGGAGGGGGGPDRRFVSVRRGQVLDDAISGLGNAAPEELRGRIRISFVNELGAVEAGVDGGGLFKEFLESVVKEGFDPRQGLFRATTDNRLYPNPHAARAVPNAPRLLEFLGRMVGKALWEGILIELPLATFFLKKFRGAACDVDDLPTLDPLLARSLMSLEEYPGDVADLGLSFSLTDDVMGKPEEIDLIPGGRDVAVTSANAALFVHRVADFRLNTQLRAPTAFFLRGLHALIPREWIEMFNDMELQELIGGVEGGARLDLIDMRKYVQYAAGYSAEHPVIVAFWEALGSMSPNEQADFLRFVTSCPRPPLLGFAYLEPPLCIQMAGGEGGEGSERLPTAATCMNLLKLPPYKGGAKQLRDKLVYAIQSGAGFDLS